MAIDEEPLLSRTSEVNRIVNGKSPGITGLSAFSASAPWPNSRLDSLAIKTFAKIIKQFTIFFNYAAIMELDLYL